MNWDELYAMQETLDQYIETNHDLTNVALTQEKILALFVEIGELANETRCFKFWSNKKPSPKDKIQEEYVDGIHFLMSIGIDQGHRYYPVSIPDAEVDQTTQFNHVLDMCTRYANEPSQRHYQQMFTAFLTLGRLLNITQTDIYNAYMAKNKTNYIRQDQGY